MHRALSAINTILIHWFLRGRPVGRSTASDRAPGRLWGADLPTARYDPVGLTFTCPHCRQTLLIDEWVLIETGYERHWSLDPYTADLIGRVTATDRRFSDNGDDGRPRLVHESHDCDRVSLVPENFEWDWN